MTVIRSAKGTDRAERWTQEKTLLPAILIVLTMSVGLGAAATVSTMVLPAVFGLAVIIILATSDSYTALGVIASALVLLLLAPLPSVVPTAIYFAGGSLYFADLISMLGIVFVCMLHSTSSKLKGCIYVSGLMAVLFVLVGIVNGATPGAAFADVRGPLRLLAGTVITYQLISLNRTKAIRLLVWLSTFITIWTAAVVASIAFLGVSAFNIRTSNAAVYTTSKSIIYDTARVTPDSGLTCVVIAGCLLSLRLVWSYTPIKQPIMWWGVVGSGIFVGLVSYTRGHFLVLLLIVVLTAAVPQSRMRNFVRMATGATILALFFLLSYQLVDAVSTQYGENLLRPFSAFRGKVLDGLLVENVQVDTSALWRVRESGLALEYFSNNWLLGSGFGARYRTFARGEIFEGVRGLTYIHNGYLWILIKTGIIGSIGVVLACAMGIRAVFRASRLHNLSFVALVGLAVLAALATQMITSPTMIENANSLLVGIVVGVVGYSLRSTADSSRDQRGLTYGRGQGFSRSQVEESR
ncbi:O-antigen ligase family protein [Rhodococcus sp. WWJCD1]|uniref:O-antigen ligase family protein n=1 Tax=Rhodococcus sp. WWJCD1 TaxID=2022519 RepID=UPI001595911C|nr:O-antigen ligase family protein [Rhodococcus sp. WWJCD1]